MSTEFEDRELTCSDCSQEFVFERGEQVYFAERDFTPPKRCKPCRQTNKARLVRDGIARPGQPQQGQTEITCSECGAPTVVPFVPSAGRPVYCYPCLKGPEGVAER